ncbi:MAG: 6-bladed beta-propeller [Candidatus Aminicenantes bacterium]|nr:6-bladed beta-propeller [Candidatus Aminicenantes bacterium]
MRRTVQIILSLFLFLLFLGLGEAQKVKTVDGVIIISNGKKPNPQKGVPSKIRFKEDFTIGAGDDPDKSFSEVSSFEVDDDGTIYVLDFKDVKIKIFDKTGKFVTLFGEKGQGPGEFDMPAGIHFSPDDELVIEDALGRKLVFFDKKGKFIKNLSLADKLGVVNILMDSKGGFIAREMGFEQNQMFFEMKKYDREFKPLFTLDKIKFPAPIPGSGNKMNLMDVMAVYEFDKEDNIFYGRNLEYEIKVLSPDGKHMRSIQKEFDPVKITEEDKVKMLKLIQSTGVGNIQDLFEFPKNFPPYQFFTLDEEGRLFVKTWEKGKIEDEFAIDVFDIEGRYMEKFETKADIRLWKDGKMYAVVEDDEGFRVIKRYSVFWEK